MIGEKKIKPFLKFDKWSLREIWLIVLQQNDSFFKIHIYSGIQLAENN